MDFLGYKNIQIYLFIQKGEVQVKKFKVD